jgi:hypothetical protein
LPKAFRPILRLHPDGPYVQAYIDLRTGVPQVEDPRMTDLLSPGWGLESHKDEKYAQRFFYRRPAGARA